MKQQSFQLAILLIGIFFITSCSDRESITEEEVEEEILTDIYIPDSNFKVVGYKHNIFIKSSLASALKLINTSS